MAAVIGIGVLVGASACSGSSGGGGNPSDSIAGSGASASSGGSGSSGSGSLRASPSPTASPITGDCGSVLPVSAVNEVVGSQVTGDTSFIIGTPEPSIDRISYLNCRYGIPPQSNAPGGSAPATGAAAPTPSGGASEPEAQVEVGISAYGSDASAQSRVKGTVEAYLQTGATQKNVPVGSLAGIELVGSGSPTLVLASGNRTVAVTVVPSLVPDATRDAILSGLAQRALTGVGG